MRRRLEYLASKKRHEDMLFFLRWSGFKGEVQERGAPASRSIRPGDILTAVIAGGVICAALVGGILLRGVVLLGGRLHALAVIAGIGGGALGGALGIAFGVAHSLVVACCADQVGGGSPQAFTRLGVGINGSVGSAYRCGIQVKVGQVATFRLMASSTSTMVT